MATGGEGPAPASSLPAFADEVTTMLNLAARLAARLAATRGRQEGQGLAEYSLLLGLIAIVAITALLFLGNAVSGTLSYDWIQIRDAGR